MHFWGSQIHWATAATKLSANILASVIAKTLHMLHFTVHMLDLLLYSLCDTVSNVWHSMLIVNKVSYIECYYLSWTRSTWSYFSHSCVHFKSLASALCGHSCATEQCNSASCTSEHQCHHQSYQTMRLFLKLHGLLFSVLGQTLSFALGPLSIIIISIVLLLANHITSFT